MMASNVLPARVVSLWVCGLALLSLHCKSGDTIAAPGDPSIGLSETTKSFSGTEGTASPAAQTIAVTNAGEGTLSELAAEVSYSTGQPTTWLNAELSATTAPSTLTLTATTGSLTAGTYTANVAVSSASANNSPQTVGVTFTVEAEAAGATIVLSSTSQNFTSLQGGPNPTAQTVEVSNGAGGTLSGLTSEVSYTAGQPTGWLSAVLSTTVAPSVVTLTASTGTLTEGTYSASVAIGSPVADNSPQTVNVIFTVVPPTAGPVISLSTTTRSFTAAQGGADPPARNVEVSNGGGGTLSGLEASTTYTAGQPAGWLTASLSATTAPSTLRLTATTGSLAPGTHTATVGVTSAVASNTPQTVNVRFTVTAAPLIALSSTSQIFSVVQGGGNPAGQTVHVTNGGGGSLSGLTASVSYTVGEPGWLNASLNQTTAPSTLTLSVTTGTLLAGTYTASVGIGSPVATNSPQTVTVTFTVQPPAVGPLIALSSTSLSFTKQVGGPEPDEQVVQVTNGGGGTLDQIDTDISYPDDAPTAWVDLALNSTTAPTEFTILALTDELLIGIHTATVLVLSPVASNSPQEVSLTITVTAPPPPEPPSDLLATAALTSEISLGWTDNSSNEEGFRIERCTGASCTDFVEIATVGPDVTGYQSTGLTSSTVYRYQVRAYNTGGTSVYSNIVSAATLSAWTTKAPMLTPRTYAASGVIDGILYIAGGSADGRDMATVEAYNPATNMWTPKASMPTPRDAAAAGVVNGILYVVGGTGAGLLATVEAYNPATNTWQTKRPMPTPRFGAAAGVVNGILYVAGGYPVQGRTVEAYNPATDTWTTKAMIPTARGATAGGVVNGLFYVAGGNNNVTGARVSANEAYDPLTNTWTTKAPVTPRYWPAGDAGNGLLYIAGGLGSLAMLEAYDPVTDTWKSEEPMPTARWGPTARVIDGVVYVVGGRTSTVPAMATVEAFQP